MEVFEVVIAILLLGAGLAAFARRFTSPYPALLALAGAALALIPGIPALVLDPELALVLFVAPVLLDAAFDSSLRDLRANWQSIAGLALGAVFLTILIVAGVAIILVPTMPWAVAIALGAIVAPPDAAAATTVLKQLHLPHRLMVILEGESLFNDASALLVYRLAVGAVVVGSVSGWNVLPTLLFVTLGSSALGVGLSKVALFISSRTYDVSTAIIFQFCATFAVWIIAENLHLSGIITIVVYAIVIAQSAQEIVKARIRIPSYAVWEVSVFVLNVLAFMLVGLQLKLVLLRTNKVEGVQYLIVAFVVCIAVIVSRLIWVLGASSYHRWRAKAKESSTPQDALRMDFKSALLVGWCGMRGTVTLASALALPTTFPHRDLILATAFGVTLGTLVFQGLTLRPLIQFLNLKMMAQWSEKSCMRATNH